MPGIVGLIQRGDATERATTLLAMTTCMMHERHYAVSTYSNDRLGLSVASINHAGAFSDCMPVWNETRDVCLVLVGEEFTDAEEVARLRARGHDCSFEDASYLVHLYEEGGLGCLAKLNGWFSGVLVDLRVGTAALFNDRYGLGRLYYHESPTGFFFSSEAKALLGVAPERRLNYQSLAEVFSCGCVLNGNSLYSHIGIVPGGSVWTFDGGRLRRTGTSTRGPGRAASRSVSRSVTNS